MTYIGKNIRKIRGVKKLSQQAFADLFGLTRANIGSYEEGRAEPKITTIVEIANKFSLDVEAILNKELKVNEISNFKGQLESEKINLNAINPDLEARLVPFVSKDNRSTYVNNLESELYLNYIPRFEIPFFKLKAARAFEVAGNELVHHGKGVNNTDIVIAIKRDAKEISSLVEGRLYIVVLGDKIIIRRLLFGLGTLELFADNQFYAPIEVYPEDVVELWEAHTLISSTGGVLKDYIPQLGLGKRKAD